MADIIAFKLKRRSSISSKPQREGGAEILFFTGVRYERVAEDERRPPRKSRKASIKKPHSRKRA